MDSGIAFRSSREIKKEREEKRIAREKVLNQAKTQYEREERKREQAKARGEDTWMLPSLEKRIEKDKEHYEKSKKHKKEKKKKKKSKKKKKTKAEKDDSSSSSEEESDEAAMWIEKSAAPVTGDDKGQDSKPVVKGPQLQRDSWMEAPLDLIPTITRKEIRDAQKAENQEDEKKVMVDQLGQHERELNPYWKEGGTGLPEENVTQKKASAPHAVGDGGFSWMKKAYGRCVEQAKEENRTLEDVAIEKYGSLQKLESMLKSAEKAYKEITRGKEKEGYRRDVDSRRERFMKPGESDRGRRGGFMRPSDDNDSGYNRQRYSESGDRLKNRFMRPGDGNSYASDNRERVRSAAPAWKKKEFHKPESHEREERDMKRSSKESKKRGYSESSSSTDSSSEEDSESDKEKENVAEAGGSGGGGGGEGTKEESEEEEVVLLSEKEMNQLGAKIVRAEIMGNTELATKLKEQLEKARENNEKYKEARPPGGENKKEENVVVLARTGASGIARPVADREHEAQRGKRRRKKEKVTTHGKSGERERYFADDDRFDLKQMVEREKMGTAEDQNSMFSRLAGRSVDKTNDDFDLDDMFVSRANAKESGAKMEEKERAMAIREHKNVSDCQMCFDKTPKHLIICIGTKVYLSLPNSKSLCEGHCLIVPMQHAVSGTVVDEDVWNEIQVFRKTLTQMFLAMDQDVVFMETCMGLRYHPHMYIECVPMEKETGDLAPIYFKKAIQESESEWSDNKKLVDLSKKDVRRSIPKGFPYFAVDFGMQGGYAHVIEDERQFPKYFGKEVVGGMIDAEPRLWRRPQKEGFEDQRKKVLQFADWWKPYDWTQS
uniref:CWF19-like protein 2 n=2 Tax=Magallana gigas TaxID=29159 RepID=A0A8W8I2B8_MAGGI